MSGATPTGLEAGHAAFLAGAQQERQPLFDELANGQSPEVLFITCADSRIDPTLITNTLPGDLFVCRNAGNIIPPHAAGAADGITASIEYAVAVLGVSHLVVCGHSSCGAMGAVLSPPPAGALPSVEPWLGLVVRPEGVDELDALIEANASQQLVNARTHPSVAAAEASGSLQLHAWTYDIGSGVIRAADANGEFQPLS